ncbi:MAG: hypothetical protein AAB157_02575, partial [Candidatus Omnitrophota bacterium]
MRVKKTKLKERNSIERVYKDGREAIVKAVKRKAAHRKPSVAVIEPSCAIKEYKSAPNITINEYELPSYNNITRITTLIPKDPFWIYAYWEIAESSIENVKKQLGGSLDGTRFV